MNPTLIITLGYLAAIVVAAVLCVRYLQPFHRRAIVSLTAVLLAALVVTRSGWLWAHGEGGFRLGVDLAGGTILVYEVDQERLDEQKRDNPQTKDISGVDRRYVIERAICGRRTRVAVLILAIRCHIVIPMQWARVGPRGGRRG